LEGKECKEPEESMYNMLERKQHDVGVMLDGQASRLGAQKVGPKAMAFGDNRSLRQ